MSGVKEEVHELKIFRSVITFDKFSNYFDYFSHEYLEFFRQFEDLYKAPRGVQFKIYESNIKMENSLYFVIEALNSGFEMYFIIDFVEDARVLLNYEAYLGIRKDLPNLIRDKSGKLTRYEYSFKKISNEILKWIIICFKEINKRRGIKFLNYELLLKLCPICKAPLEKDIPCDCKYHNVGFVKPTDSLERIDMDF